MADNKLPNESLWKRDTPSNDIKKYDESLDDSYKAPPSSDGIHFAGTDVPMPVFMRPPAPEPQQAGKLMAGNQEPINPTEIDEDMGLHEMVGKSFIVGIGDMVDSMGDMADFISGSSSSEVSKQVYGLDTSKPISDSLHNFADYLQSFGDDVPGLNDLEDVTWDDLADPNFWATGVARMLPFALSLMYPATRVARGAQLAMKGVKFARASQAIAKGAQSIGATKYATELAARGLIKTSLSVTAAGATSNLIEGATLAGQTLNEGVRQGLTENEAMNAAALVYRDNLASMAADVVQYGLFMGQLGIGKSAMKGAQQLGAKFTGTSAAKTVAGVAGKAAQKTGAAALKAPGIMGPIKGAFKAIGMGAAQGVTDGVVEQFQEVYQDWSVQRRIADEKGEDFPDYLDFFLADEQRPTRVLSFATSLLMSGASNTIRTATENRVALQRSIDERNESHEYISSFTKDLDSGKYTVKRKVNKTVTGKDGKTEVVQEEVIEELDAKEATALMRDSAAYNLAMNAVKQGDEQVVLDFLQQQFDTGSITEEQHTVYKETIQEVQQAMEGKTTHNLDNMGKTKLVTNSWLLSTSKKRLANQREQIEAKIATIEQSIEDGDITSITGKREIEGLKKLAESSLAAQEELIQAAKDGIDEVYTDSQQRADTKKFIKETAPKIKEIAAKEKRGEELTKEEQDLLNKDELSKEFYEAEKKELKVKEATEKAEEKFGKEMEGHTLNESQSVDGKYVFVKENKKDGSVSTITVNEDGTVTQDTGRIDEALDQVEKEQLEKEKAEEQKQKEEEEKKQQEEDKEEVKDEEKKEEKKEKGKIKLPEFLKPKNIKDAVGLAKVAALKFTKAFFNRERAVKILDAVEAALYRRKVRRAIKMGGGSDVTLANLYAKKAADGLISIQFLEEIYSHGETAAAYAMGLGVFVNPNAATEAPEEAIFHENFHIFRMLYGKTKEVKKMMSAVVKQPIYKMMKLDYQENILYSIPDGSGKAKILTQEDALKLLKRIQESTPQTSLFQVITDYEQFLIVNGLESSNEAKEAFYKQSKDLLSQAGYVELKDAKQVHIQDEALAKLGGLYGSVNQDIYIKGAAKTKFNEGMKAFKERIRGSVTEQEAASAFEVISKDLYNPELTRKGQMTLEEQFAKIKDVIANNEAQYRNYNSTQASQKKAYIKRKEVIKKAKDLIKQEGSSAKLQAQEYAKNSFKSLYEGTEDLNEIELRRFIEDSLNLTSSVQLGYKNIAAQLLAPYKVGSKEYNITKEIIRDKATAIKNILLNQHKQALRNTIGQKALGVLNKEENLEFKALEKKYKEAKDSLGLKDENGELLDVDADATFSILLDDSPQQISEKLNLALEFHVRKENFTTGGESISKDALLGHVRDYINKFDTKEEFINDAWNLMTRLQKLTPDNDVEQHLNNFFLYLTQELDIIPFTSPLTAKGAGISYGTALEGLYTQVDSMTTEKSMMLTKDGYTIVSNIQSARAVNRALQEVLMLDTNFIRPGSFRKNNLDTLSKISVNNTGNFEQNSRGQYIKRMRYSQDLAGLAFNENISDDRLLDFINTYFLPLGNHKSGSAFKFKKEALTEYRIYDDASGNLLTLKEYFHQEKLKQIFWDSTRISFNQGDDWKKNLTLEQAKKQAHSQVFMPIFRGNFEGNKVNLTNDKVYEVEDEFFKRIEFAYKNTTKFPGQDKDVTYVDELFTEPTLGVLKDEQKYNGYVRNQGTTAKMVTIDLKSQKEIDAMLKDLGLSSLDEALDVFGLKKQDLSLGLSYRKAEKIWESLERGSLAMYTSENKQTNSFYTNIVFNELQGHKKIAKSVITTFNNEMEQPYMSTIITPEGVSLNKNTRKYFLEYNKEQLESLLKTDEGQATFYNLFSTLNGFENPYAMNMMSGDYELNFISLDGSIVNEGVNRENITAGEVTEGDISEINTALKSGSKTYLQVIRDYSDKSRRYSVKANITRPTRITLDTFTRVRMPKINNAAFKEFESLDKKRGPQGFAGKDATKNEARWTSLKKMFAKEWLKSEGKALQVELDMIREYHEAKTQAIVARHNDKNTDFSLFNVASQETIDFINKKYPLEGYSKSASVAGKGELNLLSTKAFEQTIGDNIVDLTNVDAHVDMMSEMGRDLEDVIASINYFKNKFWLQDLHSFAGEEQSFNAKNKRSTGFIAPHDKLYDGEQVETIVFEDPKIDLEDQVQKVQVLNYNTGKLESVDLTPKMADSASYITMEEAQRIMDAHGGLTGARGSYKLVGFGRNITNQKIASHSGLEASQFYFKGHTIVLNNKVKGPLKGVYTKLKSREAFYIKEGLSNHRVIAYDSEAVKKGRVKGVTTFTLAQLNDRNFDINVEMDKWSYDPINNVRGYDGRFFGIQNELDKESETATVAKQGISNINVFSDHWSSSVQAQSRKVMAAYAKALDLQFDEDFEGFSFESLASQDLAESSMPPAQRAMFADGNLSLPVMRERAMEIINSRLRKGFKLRTKGTLSLQESDIVEGHEFKGDKLIENNDTLKPISVIEKDGDFVVSHAEAVVSSHMARTMGVKEGDLIVATRIPASSAGSTIVLKVKKISTKPGNTIAVSAKTSEIIGSDLDGDMLHINVLEKAKKGKKLTELQQAKNNIVQSIIDLYSMPEVVNMLTQIIEFEKNIAEPTNLALFGNKEGSTDVDNDFGLLGAMNTYETSKGNVPMIGNIAAQNLTFNYIAENNPRLYFEIEEGYSSPITIKTKNVRKGYTNLSNNISKDGTGTFYELCNYLNLVLDDGKYGNRAKFQFIKETASQFITLIKYGMKPAEISVFLKQQDYGRFAGMTGKDLRELAEGAAMRLYAKTGTGIKTSLPLSAMIERVFAGVTGLEFDLTEMTGTQEGSFSQEGRDKSILFYYVTKQISQNIMDLSLFVGLDKRYTSDSITGLIDHQKAVKALKIQQDINKNINKNPVVVRHRGTNAKLLYDSLSQSPELSNGYGEGLLGEYLVDQPMAPELNGILSSEIEEVPIGTEGETMKFSKALYSQEDVSSNAEKNKKITKALNLGRVLLHADYDINQELNDLFVDFNKGESPISNWGRMSTKAKFWTVQDLVASRLLEARQEGKFEGNKWLDKDGILSITSHIAYVTNSDGKAVPVNFYRLSLNLQQIQQDLEFTEQLDLYRKDFEKLPAAAKKFIVLSDLMNTGWGSKNPAQSMVPYMSKAASKKINGFFEKVQNQDVSTFDDDMTAIKQRFNDRIQFTGVKHIDNRRIAMLLNLGLNGADIQTSKKEHTGEVSAYSEYNGGLFGIKVERLLKSTGQHVESILFGDNHLNTNAYNRTDVTPTKNHKYVYKFGKDPIRYNTAYPEASLMETFSLITDGKVSEEGHTSHDITPDSSSKKKYLKVPTHGRRFYGDIGKPLDRPEYYRAIKAQLEIEGKATTEKFKDLNDGQKEELELRYQAYLKTVDKVAEEYKEVKKLILNSTYRLDHDNKEKSMASLKARIEDASSVYKQLRDRLGRMNVIVGKEVIKADPIAKAALISFVQHKFGDHIAEYQIADWEYRHGKKFVEEITKPDSELRKKDISWLDYVFSPGDFGKGKPAIAYINKELKKTHMSYTRNISLVTQEMNEKLDALYKEKFGDGLQSWGIKAWKRYMPFGNMSFDEILFGNFFSFEDKSRKGIRRTVNDKGEFEYRDISNLELKKSLFYTGKKYGNALSLNRNGQAYKSLTDAEKDYIEMYVKFTNFYRNMIIAKGLYEDGRGANYIPNINSATWETYHRRGMFGMYYQISKGDQDIADVKIKALNPITGDIEVLDYFSWKAIYMHAPGETFTVMSKEKVGKRTITTERRPESKQTMTNLERIKEFRKIKERAQELWEAKKDDAGEDINVTSAVNELMNLEAEEGINRHLHRRSMTSAYLSTFNMHKALSNYMRLMMFQYGNQYLDPNKNVLYHLSWSSDDKAFEEVRPKYEDDFALAFTGFNDKLAEVDSAITNLDMKSTKAIDYLNKVVKGGLIKKEKNLTWTDSPYKILNQQPEKVVVNFFTQWTMYIALGLNFSAAAGNVLIGKYNAYRQNGGVGLLKGEKRFWGLSAKTGYDHSSRQKAEKMISTWGILTYRAEEVAEGVGASSISGLFFFPMVFAENWIQQASFLGNLEQEQWDSYFVDDNGELVHKSEREGMSETEKVEWQVKADDFKRRTGKNLKLTKEDVASLERKVIDVQGRGYSETDIRYIQLYSVGNMVMQFKRWFPTFLADRLRREDVNDLGDMTIGSMNASKDFLEKMWKEGKMSKPSEFRKEFEALPKHRQEAVIRFFNGTKGTMFAALLYALVLHGTDEDEWDDTEKMVEKFLGDTMLLANAPKLVYMTNIPALDTFENLYLGIYHGLAGTEYERKAKYGDKGDPKAMAHFARLLPTALRGPLQQGSAGKSGRSLN